MVAEIFAMYLEEGASLCGVSNKLRAQGIRSPRGREVWTVSSLEGYSPILSTLGGSTPGACATERRR